MPNLETDVNALVRDALSGYDPRRIENSLGAGKGTPDINYTHGWIESKFRVGWPKRDTTLVRLDHYTTEQRAWHVRRSRAGGLIHVVYMVGNEAMVYEGAKAARLLGYMPRGLTIGHADLYMQRWDPIAFNRYMVQQIKSVARAA